MSARGQKRRIDAPDEFAASVPMIATELRPRGSPSLGAKSRREQMQQITCTTARLLDHLVGAAEQLCWRFETEGLGSLKVDHQLELDRSLDRKIARLLALEDAIRI